jgi:sensor domain CHASE-containing protein
VPLGHHAIIKVLMSIRLKTALLFTILLLFTTVGLYKLTTHYFEQGFGKLELSNSARNVGRAEDVLTNNADQLSTKLSDWANWDDSYQYVIDKNPDFVESNLQNQSLVNLKLNYILFYDTKNNPVFAKSIDPGSGKDVPVSAALKKELGPTSPLLTHSSVDSVKKGFLVLPEGVLVLASRPLLNSNAEGPIHGTLIFAQYLDKSAVTELSKLSHLNLNYYGLNDRGLPTDITANKQTIIQSKVFSQPRDDHTIFGYGLMNDIYGKPALVARVEQPRTIFKEGQNAIRIFLTGLIILSSLACVATLIFFDRLLIRRITLLSHQVEGIDDASKNLVQVKAAGKDEIGRLAQSINTMLKRIYDSRELAAKNVKLTHEVTEATAALDEERQSLEEKVKGRTAELERLRETLEDQVTTRTKELNAQLAESQRINQLMINRELKMVELKNKLAKYEGSTEEKA